MEIVDRIDIDKVNEKGYSYISLDNKDGVPFDGKAAYKLVGHLIKIFNLPYAPTKVKYVLCPGRVRSKIDRQEYYVSAGELCDLYGVEWNECIVKPDKECFALEHWIAPKGSIELYPRWDGNYELPKEEE